MLTNFYKNSKNSVHEFIHQAEIDRQYFEKIRLKTIDFKSSLPQIKREILYQYFTLERFINGFFSMLIGLSLGFYCNIPILLAILSTITYFLLSIYFSSDSGFILVSQQGLFNHIEKMENEFQNALLSISHLGLDSSIIIQRICNQNNQFAKFLKYYHQSEEILKFHQEDLEALLKSLKKDTHLIQSENIEEKLDILKKLNQEIDQSILLLKNSKLSNDHSSYTSDLIEKSLFTLKKHQRCLSIKLSPQS